MVTRIFKIVPFFSLCKISDGGEKKANSEPVVLTERVELEESPLSDPEEITKTYNVHDWHNLTGTQFEVRQKNYFGKTCQVLREKKKKIVLLF